MTIPESFSALVVRENPDKSFSRSIERLSTDDLPPGEVLMRVRYSSLNYKDGLSATGNKGVSKHYPHIPGVDAAGVVVESSSPDFVSDDEVIAHGYEIGAHTKGGFSEFLRAPGEWVLKKPHGLTLRECMIYGSAGFTAGLALHHLLHHGLTPDQGPTIVTGSTGGVGSFAVALLAHAGFHVVAATGKMDDTKFLTSLGAKEIIHRDSLCDTSGRGLLQGSWAGGVDNVGGDMLDTVIRQTKPFGAIACTGNIRSGELHTSIYPFILRGVSLIGINSAFVPMPLRKQIWNRLGSDWKMVNLDSFVETVSLAELSPKIDKILKGMVKGRILVEISK